MVRHEHLSAHGSQAEILSQHLLLLRLPGCVNSVMFTELLLVKQIVLERSYGQGCQFRSKNMTEYTFFLSTHTGVLVTSSRELGR